MKMNRSEKRGRRKRDLRSDEIDVPMAPMIDVVFLLLIYFVMTIQPVEVAAHLEVLTPSSDSAPREQADPPSLIRIGIYSDGFTFDDSTVNLDLMESFLSTLSKASSTQSVLIQCAVDSPHGSLIQILNLCAKYTLKNLSIVSAN